MFDYKEDPKQDSYILKIYVEDGRKFMAGDDNNVIMIDSETKQQLQKIPISVSKSIVIRDEFTCKLSKATRGAVINITSTNTENLTIDGLTLDEYFSNFNKDKMTTEHPLYDSSNYVININIDIFDNKYYMATNDEENVKLVDINCLEEMQQVINEYITGTETETNIFIVESD